MTAAEHSNTGLDNGDADRVAKGASDDRTNR
jgi:hypothetical protein